MSSGQLFIGTSSGGFVLNTLTAGANMTVTNGSGTITLAASGTGMTWSHVTGNTSAATANGYSCDTSGGAFTLTLPGSPSAGEVVAFTDGAGTFNTNPLTIGRNSLKIMGLAEDMTVNTQYAGAQLVYDGATNGWRLA